MIRNYRAQLIQTLLMNPLLWGCLKKAKALNLMMKMNLMKEVLDLMITIFRDKWVASKWMRRKVKIKRKVEYLDLKDNYLTHGSHSRDKNWWKNP